ncbi:MAG: hypothetical protein QW515_05265 [Thermoplasmatales archaeon]
MMHEAQLHDENCFLTLTYNDENIPDFDSLDYTHVQKFMKRLRRTLEGTKYEKKIKFYRVGEYGDSFGRPHYHLIIFGFDFSCLHIFDRGRQVNKRTRWRGDDQQPQYRSTLLEHLWTHGNAEIANVNYDTCMYVAKYVTKKLLGHDKKYYKERNIEPERSSMSKGYVKPDTKERLSYPIGHEWLQKYWRDVYPRDYVVINGKKIKPPRSYDEWLEKHHPEIYEEVKKNREDSYKDVDFERLNVEHEVRVRIHENYKQQLKSSHDWHAINYLKGEMYGESV